METLNVLWFKRDLRLRDHDALRAAAQGGRVLPLYCVEPGYWALPDTSYRHWNFIRGAVADLQASIADHGGTLKVRVGDIDDVLNTIYETHGPFHLHAHRETGNWWTFERDKRVHRWCATRGVVFTEHLQHGIWRGGELNRDKWAADWDGMMGEPIRSVPFPIHWEPCESDVLPGADALGLAHDGLEHTQEPGRDAALETLRSFLYERGETYQRAMSSPLAGADACSRLSVHLAAGSISIREAYHAALKRQREVAGLPANLKGDWPKALQSFIGRLHWHCHFMQKLEAEPELEWLPMARAYKDLRTTDAWNPKHLEAFEQGTTGYPFVDACLRSLKATGWINFRMRAMLMSFASYDLWLPWQESGKVLARWFTDYEPGIHWPQSQMQSGETGINTVRVYSPVKQGYDQDPDGVFIKRWVPELSGLEGKDLHEPWRLTLPLADYPDPIVDHKKAVAKAKAALFAVRQTAEAKAEAKRVFEKHGSRKRRGRPARKAAPKRPTGDERQAEFSLAPAKGI